MKKLITVMFFILLSMANAELIVVKNDNDKVKNVTPSRPSWEESVILVPDGPCKVKSILIYFNGTTPGKDTVYVVGDPSEGTIVPTLWILPYNIKIPPIEIDYNGVPGWDTIAVDGLVSDGLDRIIIQHALKAKGPWFAIDNNGASTPYRSYLMDPNTNNSLGGPGQYYLGDGDYMIRLLVEYDYPMGKTSQPPPPPTLVDATKESGLVNSSGNPIGADQVSVVDWNNDGWDDVAIGANFFQNNGDGTFKNVTSQFNISAGNTSWGDYDNDGNIDCFALVNGGYNDSLKITYSANKVYKNNGNGTFTMINPKELFKLPYPSGLVDFQESTTDVQDSLFNPYPCITPLWLDYNNDGKLDLFFANNRTGFTDKQGQYAERYFPDELWMQDADGTFKMTTKTSEIDLGEPFSQANTTWYGYYDCYGANACDYNMDNKPDIFVANYRLIKDNLFKNKGDGTFVDVAPETGVQGATTPSGYPGYFGHGMGSEWGDFNNDGYPDLCVGNLGHPDWRGANSNPSLMFKNNGPSSNYTFTEMHQEMGLKFFEMNAGVLWADFDLDGLLDLWHGQISYNAESATEPKRPGHYYINQGPPDYKLKDVTWQTNALVHGPWSAARIDYDHDGDLDILVCSGYEGVKLFRNEMVRKGNWIAIRLKGSPADQVNMDCYGSKAIVYAGGKLFYRDLMGSMSGTKCNQNSSELHFGIGTATTIDSLVITYPNGKKNVILNLNINNRYNIAYMQTPNVGKPPTPALVYPNHLQSKLALTDKMRWSISAGCVYQLQVSESSDFTSPIIDEKSLSSEEFSMSTLQDHKFYYWHVRAIKNTDTTIWSTPRAFNVGLPLPSMPALVSPANDTTKVKSLTPFVWSAATYNSLCQTTTSYQIQISETNDFKTTSFDTTGLTTLNYTMSSPLKAGTKYYWHVRALNETEPGEWSSTRAFTVMPLPSIPAQTEPVDNAVNVDTRPQFTWAAADNAEYYAVQISTKQDFSTMFYENTKITKITNKFIKTFTTSTKYYWHVRADNGAGQGAWSPTWSFTTTNGIGVDDNFEGYSLNDIVPNPFTEKTQISITIPKPELVRLAIYDLQGKELAIICDKIMEAGNHQFYFSAGNLSSGIYYCKMTAGAFIKTNAIVIEK